MEDFETATNPAWASILAATAAITKEPSGGFGRAVRESVRPFIKTGRNSHRPREATHREYHPYMFRLTSGYGSKAHVHRLLQELEDGRIYTFTPVEEHLGADAATGVNYSILGTALLRSQDVVYQWTHIEVAINSLGDNFENCIASTLRDAARTRWGVPTTTVSIMMKLSVNSRRVRVIGGSCMVWGADFTTHVVLGKGNDHSCIAVFAQSLTSLVKVLCCSDPFKKIQPKSAVKTNSIGRRSAAARRKLKKKQASPRGGRKGQKAAQESDSTTNSGIMNFEEARDSSGLEDGECGECESCLDKLAAARRLLN